MTNPQPVRDRFASPEYCNPNAKLPFIQSLRGENPSECSFFVSLDQMAKASWLNVPETLDSYTFSSGTVERGLLLHQPRMLVVPKSGLLASRVLQLLDIPVSDAVLAAAKSVVQIAPAIEPVTQIDSIDDSEDESDIPF